MDQERRRFLKHAGAAGALVWSAPLITSVARAQAGGTAACGCGGRAYGIGVKYNNGSNLFEEFYGDTAEQTESTDPAVCDSPVRDAVASGTALVSGSDACGATSFAASCEASGSTSGFTVVVPNPAQTTVSSTQAFLASVVASCDCTTAPGYVGVPAGTSFTAQRDGSAAQTFTATGAANQAFGPQDLGSSTIVSGVFNEQKQECRYGVRYHVINAARIIVTKGSHVAVITVGHAETTSDCAC